MVVSSRRSLAWSKEPFGAEFVQVRLEKDSLEATGVALGAAPLPYRLDYTLETVARFVTERLTVSAQGDGWSRSLELRRTRAGVWEETWREDGIPRVPLPRARTDIRAFSDALDVDLGLSPLFNTMPALRHGLVRSAGSVDLVAAWVSVPNLAVQQSPQRYSFVRLIDDERSVVRFESTAGDGFVADITYDSVGLVLDYPRIAERLP